MSEKRKETIDLVKQSIERRRNLVSQFFIDIGNISLFTFHVIGQFFTRPFESRELFKHAFNIGNKSFLLIITTGFILGIVLTMQAQPILAQFGAQSLIPGMVAVSVIRELGPVVTALLAAGKIGSGIAAEIGAMRVSEQIDAMEVSGTRPISFVVAPRVLASTVMIPILVVFSEMACFMGSFFAVNLYEEMSVQLFLINAFEILEFIDVYPAIIKSIIFGFAIGIIASYKGYNADKGSESIGKVSNSAVVTASLSVFVIDLLTIMITNLIN